MHRDKYGFIWIGTQFGLNLYNGYEVKVFNIDPKNPRLFQSFDRDTMNPSRGMCYDNSNNIFMDRSGNFWVGSSSLDMGAALSKFDKKTGTFIHFLNDPSDPESFNDEVVCSMVEDRDGTLWAATWGGGLLEIIDSEHGKFKQYRHDENDQYSLLDDNLNTVFEDLKKLSCLFCSCFMYII